MKARINYLKRIRAVKKLTLIRNISFSIGVANSLPLLIMAGSDGEAIKIIIGGFIVCGFFMGLSAYIEYFVLNNLIKNNDITFKTMFSWPEEFVDNSYYTWLRQHNLKDTNQNFRKYLISTQ